MKKILLAFDGENYSKGAFEFARRMNELKPVMLVGVFLPQVDLSVAWSYAGNTSASIPMLEKTGSRIVMRNIHQFEQDCVRNQIEYRVHEVRYDLAIPELRKETRYADLLILGSEKFYENLGMETPNEYLKMTIQEAECPVILVPEKFTFPESVVLAYDGSDDAAFAIKSFAYLFPELGRKKTALVYITNKSGEEIPGKSYIEELAASHYSNLTFQVLEKHDKSDFSDWLNELKNPVLVSGSYGRSDLSMMFKKSFAAGVINDHKLPVFIAHR